MVPMPPMSVYTAEVASYQNTIFMMIQTILQSSITPNMQKESLHTHHIIIIQVFVSLFGSLSGIWELQKYLNVSVSVYKLPTFR